MDMPLTPMQDMHYLPKVLEVNADRACGFFHFILLGWLAVISKTPRATEKWETVFSFSIEGSTN